MANQIKCPKCNSEQITANKKGFSAGKAVAGALLTGGIGIVAGAIGKDKVIITCLSCGNQWAPGSKPKPAAPTQKPLTEAEKEMANFTLKALGIGFVIFILLIWAYRSCNA